MRVALVIRDGPQNPATRIRMLRLVPELERAGLTVRVVTWQPRSRAAVAHGAQQVLRAAAWADAVVLQRPTQPVSLIRALRRVNRRIVVDFDDALWVGAAGVPAHDAAERVIAAVRSARIVSVGSAYLAQWAADTSDADVRVIRSSVDLSSIRMARQRPTSRPVILWVGTPGNFSDFTPPVLAVLEELVAEGSARLQILSSAPFEGCPASEWLTWSEEAEADALAGASIGIMPLVDDPRSRGRCGYKAIQYMAAGLPVVASPVGVAPELVQPQVNGALADGPDEWRDALDLLLHDADMRASQGRSGRCWVHENATTEIAARRFVQALQDAVDVA